MSKKGTTKSPPSTSAKKPNSAGIKDLPMKGRHAAGGDAVVGGAVSLNLAKQSVEYKPQRP
jgi:hypothetical protein